MNTAQNATNEFKVLGTTPTRPDGLDKVTGRAIFADDFQLPGMLHGKILRSPHAHARIVAIDTRAAAALPGVRAVVTSADFPKVEHKLTDHGAAGMMNMGEAADNCMAKDKVFYDGHAVAAVAADNPHVAAEATGLIEVEYALLPPLMSVRAAMAEDAPAIHEEYFPGAFIMPTEKCLPNASRMQFGEGDLERGFAEADLVLEREYTAETIHQGYIESHVTTVSWDSNDQVTVWTSTQGQFALRDHLAELIHVPISDINVVPLEIGGGFGGKERTYIDSVAAVLSKKTGCPVKIAMGRDEVFRATGPSPGAHIKLKFGVKRDGALTAADLHLAYEAGAYAGGPVFLGVLSAMSRYNAPNIRVNGFDVIVNKPTMRPYRAPGAPQALFAVEQMMDELAGKLNLDPIDFRMKNLARTGDRLLPGFPLAPIDTENLLKTVQAHPHYAAPLEGPNQGRGLAYSLWFNIGEASSARMQVNPDGSVTLTTASPDLSGTRIALAMQAAEALGIAVEQVTPAVADTRSIGFSAPSVGSRTTYGTGAVVCQAAQAVLKQMRERAALLWEMDPEQVTVERGVFSNGTDTLSFNEVAARMFETGGPISSEKTDAPDGFIPGIAAHLVDVEVDPGTGKVDILRYTIFQDVGKAVHPDYVEGQMQGAAAQGIGMALNEEYFYDEEGRMKNASLLDYRMPTALDLPMMETVILESPNPAHPFGVRGCGEISIAPPPAAIANAIHAAVGIRLNSMPMAPRKVCAALNAQRGRGNGGG